MARGNGVRSLGVVVGSLVVLFSACPKASLYDPALEAASTDWRSKIGDFITSAEQKAGTPDGTLEANKQFYEDMQKSIGEQIARTKAGSGSERAIQILESLSSSIEKLRKLHELGGEGGLTQAMGEPARQIIETELRALEKLQSEYKGGGGEATPNG
jgi:hypothetical protein